MNEPQQNPPDASTFESIAINSFKTMPHEWHTTIRNEIIQITEAK